MNLSIVVPAYNEENRIKTTLLAIDDFLESSDVKAEVIVVNDGSNDRTEKIVEKCAKNMPYVRVISYDENRGKGYAVRLGVEESKGDYILFTDADNSTPIEEVEKLMAEIKQHGYDIAIGSRYLSRSQVKVKQPWFRILIGKLGNVLINVFLIKNIRDTQCGFKLFKADVAKKIFNRQKIDRFGFDMEILTIAKLHGYKIKEVPVSWFNSAESRFRPIKDTFKTLHEFLRIKLNAVRGIYK